MSNPIKGDAIEQMCREYWNAFRDGHLAVGGDPLYPTWDDFSEELAKDETRRCMRYAVEALLSLPDSAFTDSEPKTDQAHVKMERGSFAKVFARVFPDKPERRKKRAKLSTEKRMAAQNAKWAEKMGAKRA